MRALLLIPVLLLAACASTDKNGRDLSPAPPSPNWTQVEADPVISANPDGTYTVKESLVQYATQARQWIKRLEEWKKKNEIP